MKASHQPFWWDPRSYDMPLLMPKQSCGDPLWQQLGPGPCGTTMLSGHLPPHVMIMLQALHMPTTRCAIAVFMLNDEYAEFGHSCHLARPATSDYLNELLQLHSVWRT